MKNIFSLALLFFPFQISAARLVLASPKADGNDA
jgi:hypothetical protein